MIETLRARRADLSAELRNIVDSDNPTDAQLRRCDELLEEIPRLDARIDELGDSETRSARLASARSGAENDSLRAQSVYNGQPHSPSFFRDLATISIRGYDAG